MPLMILQKIQVAAMVVTSFGQRQVGSAFVMREVSRPGRSGGVGLLVCWLASAC